MFYDYGILLFLLNISVSTPQQLMFCETPIRKRSNMRFQISQFYVFFFLKFLFIYCSKPQTKYSSPSARKKHWADENKCVSPISTTCLDHLGDENICYEAKISYPFASLSRSELNFLV